MAPNQEEEEPQPEQPEQPQQQPAVQPRQQAEQQQPGRRRRPEAPPRPLSPPLYALFAVGAPLLLALFVVGVAGLIVLMDVKGERQLSRTQFAVVWRAILAKNMFVQPFAVNFGFIGFVFCVQRLFSHHQFHRQAQATKED